MSVEALLNDEIQKEQSATPEMEIMSPSEVIELFAKDQKLDTTTLQVGLDLLKEAE